MKLNFTNRNKASLILAGANRSVKYDISTRNTELKFLVGTYQIR
jgi:hypothetical protein